jgi:apolipoprotein N-acyltransferase
MEIARMRARETERYLVRATNTGISAIVDPRGEVLKTSPQFKQYVMTGYVHPRLGSTPYARWGDWPVALGVVFVIALGAWGVRRG